MKIAAIALDLDGTLVDSVPDLAAAANRIRHLQALPPLDDARMRSFVGDGVSALLKRALTDSMTQEPEPAAFQRALQAFHRDYAEHLADATQVYPGVRPALDGLTERGIRLAVVTNKPERHARALLQALNLSPYFVEVLGGDSLPERKPAPEPLWEAARRLKVRPEQLLMIGDSDKDFFSAEAAGCPCGLVTYGYGPVQQLPALAHWSELTQVLDWLDR